MITTLSALVSSSAASVGVALLTLRCSAAAAAAWTDPNAPNSTFVTDRFIALHMISDSTKPDAPSSAPATISSLFSSTKPIATADRPAYELRNEITVGMSAPPIGRISSTPKTSASAMMIGNAHDCVGSITSTTPSAAATPSSRKLTMFWPL